MLIYRQWEEFVILDDEEYTYLQVLMQAYNKLAITQYTATVPFIDVMHRPGMPQSNDHLIHVEFFIEDIRMLKLAHVSLDNKNHKFMQDICKIVEARCPQEMVDILNESLY